MKAALKDWRSTLAGVALVVTGVSQIHGAGAVSDPNVISNILGGIGLILAQFPSKKATPATPAA
jgi:hypothetical protein